MKISSSSVDTFIDKSIAELVQFRNLFVIGLPLPLKVFPLHIFFIIQFYSCSECSPTTTSKSHIRKKKSCKKCDTMMRPHSTSNETWMNIQNNRKKCFSSNSRRCTKIFDLIELKNRENSDEKWNFSENVGTKEEPTNSVFLLIFLCCKRAMKWKFIAFIMIYDIFLPF